MKRHEQEAVATLRRLPEHFYPHLLPSRHADISPYHLCERREYHQYETLVWAEGEPLKAKQAIAKLAPNHSIVVAQESLPNNFHSPVVPTHTDLPA